MYLAAAALTLGFAFGFALWFMTKSKPVPRPAGATSPIFGWDWTGNPVIVGWH